MLGMLQEAENQKLRAELQAATIQLAAVEAVPSQHRSLPTEGDELLATWQLEDWRDEETGACYLLDSVTDAVYQQEAGSHAWPHPIGCLVRKGGSENQTPFHAVSGLMCSIHDVLLTDDWTRCVIEGVRMCILAAAPLLHQCLTCFLRIMDNSFKDQAAEVGKQDALKVLMEVLTSSGSDVKDDTVSVQVASLLDSLQLFSSGTVQRKQLERELKDCCQLYQQMSSQDNASLTTDATLVLTHFCSQKITCQTQVCSLERQVSVCS